jgi:hypothetical protein
MYKGKGHTSAVARSEQVGSNLENDLVRWKRKNRCSGTYLSKGSGFSSCSTVGFDWCYFNRPPVADLPNSIEYHCTEQ